MGRVSALWWCCQSVAWFRDPRRATSRVMGAYVAQGASVLAGMKRAPLCSPRWLIATGLAAQVLYSCIPRGSSGGDGGVVAWPDTCAARHAPDYRRAGFARTVAQMTVTFEGMSTGEAAFCLPRLGVLNTDIHADRR